LSSIIKHAFDAFRYIVTPLSYTPKQGSKTIAKSVFGEDIRKVLQYEVEV